VGILNVASLIEIHLGGRIATTIERPVFRWGGPDGVATTPAYADLAYASQAGAGGSSATPLSSDKDPGSLIVRLAPAGEAGSETRAAGSL
jgi:hypothetical protein